MDPELKAKILAKISLEGDCWLWTGYTVSETRLDPVIKFHHKTIRVRRALYEDAHGAIGKQYLRSICGNAKCVNPAHVEIVVAKTNAKTCREYQAKKAQRQLSSFDRVRRLARRCGFRFVEKSKGVYDICRS